MIERHVLMAGCLARTPFRVLVEAAGKTDFEGITIWPSMWRHALVKEGLSLRDIRALLDNAGLQLEQVEAIRDWPPKDDSLAVCAELGARFVVAMRMDCSSIDLAREADLFGKFAERCNAFGVRPAIEFVAFSGIPDAATAWAIIQQSDSDKAGIVVDLCHHVRGGGSDEALFAIPPERIVSIQLADGPAQAPADLADEAANGRLWPGEGDFNVAHFVQKLHDAGVRASGGIELYRPDFLLHKPIDVIRRLEAEGRPFTGRSTANQPVI